MAGYLGSRPVVVQVDGYQRTEAESRYVNVSGDDFTGHLDFTDDAKARFGSSDEMHIYTESSGSGYSYIQGDSIVLRKADQSTNYLTALGGVVSLMHSGNTKLATASGGINVTGTVTSTGNITAGSSTAGVVTVGSANGFEIQKSGVNGYINQSDSGPIIIRMGSGYSERLRLTTAGNLGLGGTPATNTKLLVKAGTNLNFEVENSSSNLRLSALNDARSANVGMQFASSGFEFLTGNTTFNGNVAISASSGDTLTLTKSTTEPSLRIEGDANKDFVFTVSGELLTLTQNDGATDIVTFDHDTKAATFAGNVGINTTNPQVKLQVNDSGTAASTSGYGTGFNIARSDGLVGMTMGYTSANNSTYIQGRNFTNTDTQPIAINPLGGNVGIGTTSPNAGLEVLKSGGGKIRISETSAKYVEIIGYAEGAANGSTMAFHTNQAGTSTSTERMRIDSSGNVGIGDTSPDRKLHVNSGATNVVAQFQSTDGTAAIELKDNAGTAEVAAQGNDLVIMPAGAERMRVAQAGTTTIAGAYSTTNSVNYVLRLQSSSSGSAVAGHGTGIQFLGERNDGNVQSLALIQAVTLTNSGTSIAAGLHFYTGSGGAPSERMSITSVGQFVMPGVYNDTTSDAANINVRSDGLHRRSTSSLRYKNTINDATHGLTELLTLRPVTYKGNNDGDTVFGGLIAEEVHDAGLTEFVDYDSENRPDALRYPHMISLCVKALQEQQEVIESLTARITALEA